MLRVAEPEFLCLDADCGPRDPRDLRTGLGPQMNDIQLRHVEEYVAAARARGATVHTGGKAAAEHGALFYPPTVITGLSHEDVTEMGEVFGPIAPVIPVDTFHEALDKANDSELGLGANVLTSNSEYAMLAARELRFGSVWVNNPLFDNNAGPFGGFRQSGYGRELGEEGYEAFLETKHVTFEYKIRPQDFWFRQDADSISGRDDDHAED
jgi:acyl-CoA reductase-like NAD-dependent aldehyde dehydrogenase